MSPDINLNANPIENTNYKIIILIKSNYSSLIHTITKNLY